VGEAEAEGKEGDTERLAVGRGVAGKVGAEKGMAKVRISLGNGQSVSDHGIGLRSRELPRRQLSRE
jgi:hypothetical protein